MTRRSPSSADLAGVDLYAAALQLVSAHAAGADPDPSALAGIGRVPRRTRLVLRSSLAPALIMIAGELAKTPDGAKRLTEMVIRHALPSDPTGGAA